MRVLITGGAGFIGSHLAERLLSEGHEIACLDDFNDFYDPAFKRENAALLSKNSKFTLIEGDIRDAQKVKAAFKKKPDAVVHLAARAGVRPSLQQPLLYSDVNVSGTIQILEAMREAGVKKMIFASSSSVYGVNSKLPFSEEDPLLTPISPYAATKIAGEMLCRTYYQLYGIDSVCLRFFTVYGPRQRPEMAIYKFTQALLQEKEITVYGDGDTRRDYTYVADIIDGVCASMKAKPGVHVYNLGDSQPVALRDLLSKLEEITGKKGKFKKMPVQAGDVPVTYANLAKSKKELGYSPKVLLDSGLEKFVRWYKESRYPQLKCC